MKEKEGKNLKEEGRHSGKNYKKENEIKRNWKEKEKEV